MNIKEYLDILKDLWTPNNASKIRMAINNALEMMGKNLADNINRQGNVESQFQDVLDETTNKDFNSAPEIRAARGGEANLKARLDKEHQKVAAQLDQKVGGGKLATANDLDEDLLNFISDGVGGPISVESIPKDGSVTPEKTTFIELSSNLFDRSRVIPGILDSQTGELVESTNYSTTDYFIPVEAGKTYTFKNIGRLHHFNSMGVNDGGFRELDSDGVVYATIPESLGDERFIKVSLFNRHVDIAQINEGDTLLPYEPYYMRFMGQITSNGDLNNLEVKLELESSGLNLNTGLINSSGVSDWDSSRRTGKYLSVTPDTPIELDFDVGKAYIFEYDKDFNVIKNTVVVTNQVLMLSNATNYLKVMFDSLDKGQYVNCNLSYMSESTTPKWVYNDRKNSNVFSFVYEVDVNQGREVLINDDLDTKQYTTEKYYNSALLKLPPNYSPTGKPVKLIIANGGAGSHTTFAQQDFAVMYRPYFDYLADEGYAVLDLYKWTTKYMVRPGANFGTPTSISTIVQGYKWVIENFNISDTGVFVWGYSAGGYPSTILDTDKGLPVLATGMFAPAISPLTRPYGYDAESRLAYADDFGFTGDVEGFLNTEYNITPKTEEFKQFMIENADKIIGYNGFWNGLTGIDLNNLITHVVNDEEDVMSNFENAYRIKSVPTKIWVSEDDTAVSAEICKVYLQTIKNGHGVGELRLMPNGTGGHYSVSDDPNALKVDNITTKLGVAHTDVPLAFVELVQFYRRYEN